MGLNATLDVVSEQAGALVPRAVSVRFHGRCGDGPLDIRAKAERVNASSTIVATEVRQDGEVVVSSVTTLTAPRPGLSLQNTQGPVAAPPEACQVFQLPADLVPFGRQVEIRPAGGALPLTGSDLAEMRAWLRLRTALPVDPTVAVVLADALAPGIFPRLIAPVAVPTVELTVHFHGNLRSAPVDDWVLAVQRNVSCDDGWCVDETELWSRGGKLLAQARQLRRLLGPQPWPPDVRGGTSTGTGVLRPCRDLGGSDGCSTTAGHSALSSHSRITKNREPRPRVRASSKLTESSA